jgi:hypothetical protein
MTFHVLPFDPVAPEERRARTWVATVLRAASRMLDALAERLALAEARVALEPVLEFHGDAAAPEGALYVNGQLVGLVLGVTRL